MAVCDVQSHYKVVKFDTLYIFKLVAIGYI